MGLMLARLITVCDVLLEDSLRWLHPGASARPCRSGHRATRRCWTATPTRLAELTAPAEDAPDA